MSLHDRAAQFHPFAALTGREEAIKETARLTEEKIDSYEKLVVMDNGAKITMGQIVEIEQISGEK